MKKEEAKQIIINICQNVRGTLAEHARIQQALNVVLNEKIQKPKEKDEKK